MDSSPILFQTCPSFWFNMWVSKCVIQCLNGNKRRGEIRLPTKFKRPCWRLWKAWICVLASFQWICKSWYREGSWWSLDPGVFSEHKPSPPWLSPMLLGLLDLSLAWWQMSASQHSGGLKQDDWYLGASLGHKVRPGSKTYTKAGPADHSLLFHRTRIHLPAAT